MNITPFLPALLITIPLCGALLSTISFRNVFSWSIALISSLACLLVSLCCIIIVNKGIIKYNFGGWQAPNGIEYRLDYLNLPMIILLNIILFFFLSFGKELIDKTIISNIENKKKHLFYALLLFIHFGYLGILCSNDLFNIYVFIEISSLATYILISKGKTPKSLIASFDYLMLGTIGATLILIGIGFLLALTGSLNITYIALVLNGAGASRILIVAIAFFLCGSILKTAFFPMHFWALKVYSSTSPFMLTYLASVSNLTGIYIILRFIYFITNDMMIHTAIFFVFRLASIVTIIICGLCAYNTDNIKRIIIYSTSSQVGYIFLLLSINPAFELLFQFLAFDIINKISLFTIIAHIQHQTNDLQCQSFRSIEKSTLFKICTAIAIVFSVGIPITGQFIIKVKILDLFLLKNLHLEFVIVILASVLSLLYHFKFVKVIFLNPRSNGTIKINTKVYGLVCLIVIQVVAVIYLQDIATLAKYSKALIT